MKFRELKTSLGSGLRPVYLFEGADAYFRETGAAAVKAAALERPELNYVAFEGADLKGRAGELAASLSTVPFLSPKRVTFVREWYPKAEELKGKELAALFSSPPETGVLLISNEKKCDALAKLPSVTAVDCGRETPENVARMIRERAKESGTEIEPAAATAVAEYCLSDMTRAETETEKLIAYARGRGPVTEEDVALLVAKDGEYKVYELTEYLANGQKGKAYRIFGELLDRNENKQRIFAAVFSHFRRLLFASLPGKSDAELAAELGVKEYAVKVARRQSKKFTQKRLKSIVDRLIGLDVAFKSGKITPDGALMLSVFGMLAEEI